MKTQTTNTTNPATNNEQLQQKYSQTAQKYGTLNKKVIPYLIGTILLMLILAYINTFEAARPVTTPILFVLLIVIALLAGVQQTSIVKSYHNQNIAQKLDETGKEKVGMVRSITWRPLLLLTIIIVVGVVTLFWLSGGSLLPDSK